MEKTTRIKTSNMFRGMSINGPLRTLITVMRTALHCVTHKVQHRTDWNHTRLHFSVSAHRRTLEIGLGLVLCLTLAACNGDAPKSAAKNHAPEAHRVANEIAWFEGGMDAAFERAKAEGKP